MAYLRKSDKVPSKGKGARLTPKMKAWIEEFVISGNASDAVIKAGYKTKNPAQLGAELRNHPLICEELDKRETKIQDEREIERDYLLNKLIDIIESPGEKTQDRLRAVELAGKSIALWKDRQEISGPDGEAIKTEQKTAENVRDFKGKLAVLTKRASGASNVVQLKDTDNGG